MNIQHREPSWAMTNTWDAPEWAVDELVAAKAGRTVSVVLPALNEQDTVAAVVASIRPLLGSLVDELVVLDSGSTDATAEQARAAAPGWSAGNRPSRNSIRCRARARCCGVRWR